MLRFELKFGTFSWFYPINFVSCGESCLLVSWCAGGRCGMVASDKNHGRSRRPGAEDRGWSSTGRVLGVQTIKGRITPCAVCTMHKETRSASFLVEPPNQGRRFFDLGLKTGSSSLVIWASKSPLQFLGLGLKTMRASVYRLHHKTDAGMSAQDTRRDLAACFSVKQVWLGFLCLASRLAEVRRCVVHIASSWRLRRVKAKDG
jgi:hypothetical protein